MKKLIAVVLTVAMMLTVCAFSVSAEAAAPELVAEGAANVQVGDKYTVNIRLNDAGNQVGGFQGELQFTGATVDSVEVNPQVLKFNNTEDKDTVIKADEDSVNFATVADLAGTNPATRIWFKVTFKVTAAPTFTLAEVVFSDKKAAELDGTVGAALAPVVPAADAAATVALNKVGILEQIVPNDQGIVVNASIAKVADSVTEYGVVFYPTSLLEGKELTVDTANAVKAVVEKGDANFDKFINNNGEFNAVLHFNFSSDELAAKFMGTKVTARVYYKTAEGTFYSANAVEGDKYIQGGTASKAALNTVLDYGNKVVENKSDVSTDAYNAAKDALATSNTDVWYNNRVTVLTYAVENATR